MIVLIPQGKEGGVGKNLGKRRGIEIANSSKGRRGSPTVKPATLGEGEEIC